MIEQLDGVGHWVQAEDPKGFFQRANAFLVMNRKVNCVSGGGV